MRDPEGEGRGNKWNIHPRYSETETGIGDGESRDMARPGMHLNF
jgi:hypothetical protein